MTSLRPSPTRRPVARRGAHIGAWLLILPFLLLAALGPGTMVEAAPQGGLRIVLCTEQGMVEAVMTHDGQLRPTDNPDPAPASSGPPCAWALQAQPLLAGAGTVVDPGRIVPLAMAYEVEIPLNLRRTDVLTPAARGPPAFI